MKKLLAVIIMGLLVTIMFSSCKVRSTGDAFRNFETQEGGFAVLFPEKPIRRVQKIESAIGPVDIVMYSVENSEISYSVTYNEMPEGVEKNGMQEQTLNGARDNMMKDSSLKLIKESKISLGKAEGKEIIIEGGGGKVTIQDRLYIINNRMYQIMVEVKDGKYEEYTKQIQTFLNSLRVINK